MTALHLPPLPVEDPPLREAPPPDPPPAGPGPTPSPPLRPLITIDLSAWPQVQTHIPLDTPLPLIIQALELTLAQLRELHIQARPSVRG